MPETSTGLLFRLRNRADAEAWQRLAEIYTPLLYAWLRRHALQPADADDVVAEILATLARELPSFRYDRRKGSFRGWLRVILTNRLRNFRRAHQALPVSGADSSDNLLDQLADDRSDISQEWDREHDQHVVTRLLLLIQPDFEPGTWEAFRLVMLEGLDAGEVADRLHLSRNAVYLAKNHVLRRMREEAAGLIAPAAELS